MPIKLTQRLLLGLALLAGFMVGGGEAFATESLQTGTISDTLRPYWKGSYYTVRRDFRKCIYPLCGGYFIREVNRRTIRCADGHYQQECYVSKIDWSRSGLSIEQTTALALEGTLLRGTLRQAYFDHLGFQGKLFATEAWVPATEQAPKGGFVRLINSGIVCITTPCPSIREHILNRKRFKNIHGVDLSGVVGATDEQLEEVSKAIASRSGLLAAGKNQKTRINNNRAITFVASQFYLRIKPDPAHEQPNLIGVVTVSPTCGGPVIQGQICHGPYAGARIQVFDLLGSLRARAITDKEGMFSIHMAPGEYSVHVQGNILPPPIPIPVPLPEPYPIDSRSSALVDVAPDTTQADLTIYPYPMFPICPDTPVTVPEQGVAKVRIDCDTGIR